METGDKQGFLSYYDDWELYYTTEEISTPIKIENNNENSLK